MKQTEDVKEEEKLEEWDNFDTWFQYDPNRVKKHRERFEERIKQRIEEARKFWIEHKKPGQRWSLVEHLRRFRRDAGYREKRLQIHKKHWDKYAQHGMIQDYHMSEFCEHVWGFHMGDHGGEYWRAINAYNADYHGITVEDFTEMNVWIDEQAIRFMHQEPLKVIPDTF